MAYHICGMMQFFFTLALGLMHWLHPFFVSVIDVRHNAKDQTLELSVKAFTDDLEQTLRQNFPNSKPNLMGSGDGKLEDSLINRYVVSKLKLTVNDKPVTLRYIGHERVEESVWSYFEVQHIPALKSLQVQTTLMYEYKKEQINIIHAQSGDDQKSYRLSQPEQSVKLTF